MMAETYDHFMVFSLEDTGERRKLDVTEDGFRQNNGENILDSTQVYVIVKEDLRRIYIWNGAHSPVRKKFIASRVASDLQNELVTTAHFHRCKIISVDQGDEPYEFLSTFGFNSLEIIPLEEDYQSPKASSNDDDKMIYQWDGPPPDLRIFQNNTEMVKIPDINVEIEKSFKSEVYKDYVVQKVISTDLPENFRRQNLIIGDLNVLGAVSKKAKVFGKEIEETEWELVKTPPKGVVQIDNRSLRLYFNQEKGNLEAIEILEPTILPKKVSEEKKIDYNKWTVKELKEFCTKNSIKVPSSYRKVQIVKLIEGYIKK